MKLTLRFMLVFFSIITLFGCLGSKTACIDIQKASIQKNTLKTNLTGKLKLAYIQQEYHKETQKIVSENDAAILYSYVDLINQRYGNSKQFGVVCSTAVPKLKHSAPNLFTTKYISENKFCYKNPNVTVAELSKSAEDAALKKVLVQYSSDLSDINGDDAEKLVLAYEARNGHLDLKKEEYCFDFKTSYFIADVEIFKLRRNITPVLIQKVKDGKSLHSGSFVLDLSKSSVGDLPKDIGEGIVIKSASEGKGVGTYLKKSAIIFNRILSDSFKIHFMMFNEYNLTNKYTTIKLHYDEYETDAIQLSFNHSGKGINAIFQMGKESSLESAWNGAINVNEIVIEKHKNSLKYFLNGDYKFTFSTKGKNLKSIEIPIGKDDLLYQLIVTDLNENDALFKLKP